MISLCEHDGNLPGGLSVHYALQRLMFAAAHLVNLSDFTSPAIGALAAVRSNPARNGSFHAHGAKNRQTASHPMGEFAG
jgi:hypothetical protein